MICRYYILQNVLTTHSEESAAAQEQHNNKKKANALFQISCLEMHRTFWCVRMVLRLRSILKGTASY